MRRLTNARKEKLAAVQFRISQKHESVEQYKRAVIECGAGGGRAGLLGLPGSRRWHSRGVVPLEGPSRGSLDAVSGLEMLLALGSSQGHTSVTWVILQRAGAPTSASWSSWPGSAVVVFRWGLH